MSWSKLKESLSGYRRPFIPNDSGGSYPSNRDYFLKAGFLRDPGFWIIVVVVILLASVPLTGRAPEYYPPS